VNNYKILSADHKDWSNVLKNFDEKIFNDIYQSKEYLKLYENYNQKKSECFLFSLNNDYFLLSYIKNQINNKKFGTFFDFETVYGYSGPISTSEDKYFLKNAWKEFKNYCLNNSLIAGFIRFNPYLQNHKFIDSDLINLNYEKEIVVKDFKKTSEYWSNYSSDIRNKIRKAENNNIIVKVNNSEESMKAFYQLYIESMTEKKADEKYFFTENYFNDLFLTLKNKFNLFLAYKNETLVGSALTFISGQSAVIHLSANRKEFLNYGSSSLLRHEIIKFYSKKNINWINFGGGLSSSRNDNLLKFKKGFSKEVEKFYTGKLIINKKIYDNLCNDWDSKFLKNKKLFKNFFLKYNII
jgi:lipid II:glycine glycyltransferase (peptidoglycan interpeptide bridge formation enzyme)